MVEEKAVVNLKRCIECGLCVSTCPTDAVRLLKKPEDQQYLPPEIGIVLFSRYFSGRYVAVSSFFLPKSM